MHHFPCSCPISEYPPHHLDSPVVNLFCGGDSLVVKNAPIHQVCLVLMIFGGLAQLPCSFCQVLWKLEELKHLWKARRSSNGVVELNVVLSVEAELYGCTAAVVNICRWVLPLKAEYI